MRTLSAIVSNFCTLVDSNGVQWDVLSPDAINTQQNSSYSHCAVTGQ